MNIFVSTLTKTIGDTVVADGVILLTLTDNLAVDSVKIYTSLKGVYSHLRKREVINTLAMEFAVSQANKKDKIFVDFKTNYNLTKKTKMKIKEKNLRVYPVGTQSNYLAKVALIRGLDRNLKSQFGATFKKSTINAGTGRNLSYISNYSIQKSLNQLKYDLKNIINFSVNHIKLIDETLDKKFIYFDESKVDLFVEPVKLMTFVDRKSQYLIPKLLDRNLEIKYTTKKIKNLADINQNKYDFSSQEIFDMYLNYYLKIIPKFYKEGLSLQEFELTVKRLYYKFDVLTDYIKTLIVIDSIFTVHPCIKLNPSEHLMSKSINNVKVKKEVIKEAENIIIKPQLSSGNLEVEEITTSDYANLAFKDLGSKLSEALNITLPDLKQESDINDSEIKKFISPEKINIANLYTEKKGSSEFITDTLVKITEKGLKYLCELPNLTVSDNYLSDTINENQFTLMWNFYLQMVEKEAQVGVEEVKNKIKEFNLKLVPEKKLLRFLITAVVIELHDYKDIKAKNGNILSILDTPSNVFIYLEPKETNKYIFGYLVYSNYGYLINSICKELDLLNGSNKDLDLLLGRYVTKNSNFYLVDTTGEHKLKTREKKIANSGEIKDLNSRLKLVVSNYIKSLNTVKI